MGQSVTSDLAGRRILVVEDEVIVAWALEDMLAGLGCAVVGPAARINQALTMIEAEAFDAAVVDVNLDGEKSYPVVDALTARGVPFVFSTGYGKAGIAAKYGAFTVLQKPYAISKLGDALSRLLNTQPSAPAPRQAPTTPVWDANRLRIATDAAGVCLWSWNVDTDQISMDERAHALWGVPPGDVTFKDLSARIHPEDLDRVRAAFAATREILGAYEVDFRILHGRDIRWVSARGRGDDQGIVGRLMFGVFLDVTERKLAEEARELLAGEMGHRVKNLFSIACALTTISARSTQTKAEMSRDLIQRLTALSIAHDLVRPVLSEPKKAARLSDLLALLLAPYTEEKADGGRVSISVPELLVGEASATTLALVVHEFATNSIKCGALSKAAGTLDLSSVDRGADIEIIWRELGGPAVTAPTGPVGFGSQLIAKSVSGQLGGTISTDWQAEGVLITLRVSKARLGA
jgi:two-component sensor histidine kinase/PAS domain-containing protein